MKLVEPSFDFSDSFSDALKEFDDNQIHGFWNARIPLTDIDEYIQRALGYSKGINVPDNWVPSSTYWLIDNDIFVAHVNIRHQLNEYLKNIGGHIGYAVRPSMQGKGYGSSILKLALPNAREIGIKKALLTCDPENIASQKIIEKNGGIFHQEIEVNGKPILQFLIDLSSSSND